ncbi:MAG: hypothetical protein LBL58_17060 [Tannerellaceae bacterium]|jgi:hypothetical protein|nr:hypothetical protein [Tannerellaceae bacterium]
MLQHFREKTFLFIPILLFALLTLTGCRDGDEELEEINDVTNEFLEPFLGKWKEIAYGNETHSGLSDNGDVIEFLSDKTMPGRIYHSIRIQPDAVQADNFRLDAECLYVNSGKSADGYTYRYRFIATNLLRLEIVNGIVKGDAPTVIVYERVKDNEFQEPFFLGEWKETARGNDPYPELISDYGHVIEFLPGGTYYRIFTDEDESVKRYWADAENIYYIYGFPHEDIYRYTFTGPDRLRLDYANGTVSKFHIYERLKNDELQKPFLGKWKEIACGNDINPELTPDRHMIEFLPDGTYYGPFWKEDSTANYLGGAKVLFLKNGEVEQTYKYSFIHTDTLRLDFRSTNQNTFDIFMLYEPTFHIYKRLTTNEP